jgi:hypothetical protein
LKDGIPQSLLADIRSTSMSSLKKIGSVEGGLPNCASVSRSGSSSSFTGAAGGSGSRSRPDPVAELKTVLALKRQAMGVSRSGPLSADDEDWK